MKIFLNMQRLLALIERRLRPLARRHRMTTQDMVLMAWLVADSGLGGAELASKSGRSRQNTQRALHRLQRRGLVAPNVHDDLDRVIGWRVTEEGSTEWKRITEEYHRLEERFFGGRENRDGVVRFLERVQDEVVEATRPPDSRPMAATFGEPWFTSLRLTSKSTDL
jgi:DNA-binding MarR family transcriptional regulator